MRDWWEPERVGPLSGVAATGRWSCNAQRMGLGLDLGGCDDSEASLEVGDDEGIRLELLLCTPMCFHTKAVPSNQTVCARKA